MKEIDIVLINPPNHARFPHYPIGIGYLNEILLKNGFESKILDIQNMILNGEYSYDKDFMPKMQKLFKKIKSKIFAFSIMNSSYLWATEFIKIVKKYHKNCKIIIGGPHATLLKEKILSENSDVDIVTVFEGEKVIVDIVKALINNDYSLISKTKNIYYRNSEGEVLFNGEEKLIENLDILPTINYNTSEYKNRNTISLEVGRGCCYNCYFCVTNYIWKRKPRYKSAEKIVQESYSYYEKIKHNTNALVYYEHDNFLIKKHIIKEIIKQKERLGLDFNFGCSARANLLDEDIIDLLYKASCKYVFLGIETGSHRIQEISRKNLDLEKVLLYIKKLTDRGILVECNFIIGFPEERFDDLMQTYKLMTKIKWINPNMTVLNHSLMSPELTSQVQVNTDICNYIIDENSLYYLDLLKVGLTPEKYNAKHNNHLYTIKNNYYDIIKVSEFTQFFKELLLYFPITMFVLLNIYKYTIEKIYDFFSEANSEIECLRSKHFEFILKFIDKIHYKKFYNEILIFENLKLEIRKKNVELKEKITFSYPIQEIYTKLRANPNKILEEGFEKKTTVIVINSRK